MDMEGIITDGQDQDGRVTLSWLRGMDIRIWSVYSSANSFVDNKENPSTTCQDHDGRAPICWAADKGHFDSFKELVVSHSKTLHKLVREGRQAVVDMLIRGGYGRTVLDSNRRTLLQIAIEWNHTDIVKMFIPLSPINNKDAEDMTALDLAAGIKSSLSCFLSTRQIPATLERENGLVYIMHQTLYVW